MRLSWALVHSRQTEDVNRGIGMIEGRINFLFAWLKMILVATYHLTFTLFFSTMCWPTYFLAQSFDQLIEDLLLANYHLTFTLFFSTMFWSTYCSAASLDKSTSPLQTREKLYLLAVGHFRNGNYVRSRQLADRCLEVYFYLLMALYNAHFLDV
jgi:hypothetical protein